MKQIKKAADEISSMIDRELSKKHPDYNLIAELSEQYASIIGADESIEAREEQHIQEILSQAKHKKPNGQSDPGRQWQLE